MMIICADDNYHIKKYILYKDDNQIAKVHFVYKIYINNNTTQLEIYSNGKLNRILKLYKIIPFDKNNYTNSINKFYKIYMLQNK